MEFHKIDMDTWPRKSHYEAYINHLPLHWNVTCMLDVTTLQRVRRSASARLYPAVLWMTCTAVNQIPEFRMAHDSDGTLGYYDAVMPGYTIFHEDDHTFSDIWSPYDAEFAAFHKTVLKDMKDYADVKGYAARPNRPQNCCPISMAPWLSFTSCAFDTFVHTKMLLPVITFGKITVEQGQEKLPVSVFCSHSVADGWHVSQLIEKMQALADGADQWLTI